MIQHLENPDASKIRQKEKVSSSWRENLGRTKIELTAQRPASWWTGLSPDKCPGFDGQALHSLDMPILDTCSRDQVRDYFNNTWTLTELVLSSLIDEEAFYRPPYHALRHPMIFYYGHPAVLYINKLLMAGLIENEIDAAFNRLFQTGVDEMSWDDMSKNDMVWPSIDEVLEYRRAAYRLILHVIDTHPDLEAGHKQIDQSHDLWALFMGFEHERIHIETSSVLIRELPAEFIASPAAWPMLLTSSNAESAKSKPKPGSDYSENKLVKITGAEISFGKQKSWPTYGWDNEYGCRTMNVEDFSVTECLISNGEYWQFVSDGGYSDKRYWTDLGWRWRCFRDITHPTFWITTTTDTDTIKLRTCFEQITMQWNWPVIVNFHEAKAFCRWKSIKEGKTYRLLSECEHQLLRRATGFNNENRNSQTPEQPSNVSLRWGAETPVNQAVFGSTTQIYDLFGNVWQWCEDQFNPLPGFEIHPLYDDFSTPCFDGKHQMIMGGSFISTGDEASPWARFHFRPHFFQHAGFRMVLTEYGP